jgi:DNA-binding transcriptional ArsR family regulator
MRADRLNDTFAALADPTRRAILARLMAGEASVTELAEPFAMSLPAISKHLKVLERAGLITRGREAQWRPCRLEADPLREVADWVEGYRRFWEQSQERYDRLDDYLRAAQGKEPPSRPHDHRHKEPHPGEEQSHGRPAGRRRPRHP